MHPSTFVNKIAPPHQQRRLAGPCGSLAAHLHAPMPNRHRATHLHWSILRGCCGGICACGCGCCSIVIIVSRIACEQQERKGQARRSVSGFRGHDSWAAVAIPMCRGAHFKRRQARASTSVEAPCAKYCGSDVKARLWLLVWLMVGGLSVKAGACCAGLGMRSLAVCS